MLLGNSAEARICFGLGSLTKPILHAHSAIVEGWRIWLGA
jgi:hypothetical protein